VNAPLFRGEGGRPTLRDLSPPARLLVTLYLLTVAAGLAAGEFNVLASHAGADGKPGLSMEDLRRVFHGRPGWTLLGSKVDGGSMEKHVPVPSERRTLLAWAAGGAREEGFDAARKVLDLRCVRCHSPAGEKEGSPFADAREAGARYDLVVRYAGPDRGMSDAARATSTHAHLLGMGTMFLALGVVFLFTDTPRPVRAAAVAAPFAGMAIDIGSWWLSILSPAFVWAVVAGGVLVAASAAVLVARPLWEMWGPKR
jgi:hypothetical protein